VFCAEAICQVPPHHTYRDYFQPFTDVAAGRVKDFDMNKKAGKGSVSGDANGHETFI
jgi:hypothetical protein